MWIFLLLLFGFVHGKSENEIFRLKTDSWLELKEGFLQPKDEITTEFWLLIDEKPKEEVCIVSHGGWRQRLKIGLLPNLHLRWTLKIKQGRKGETVDCDTKHAINLFVWTHFAFLYASNGTIGITANGYFSQITCNKHVHYFGKSPSLERVFSGSLFNTRYPLTVGKCLSNQKDNAFHGSLFNLRIWREAKSQEEIRQTLLSLDDLHRKALVFESSMNPREKDGLYGHRWKKYNIETQTIHRFNLIHGLLRSASLQTVHEWVGEKTFFDILQEASNCGSLFISKTSRSQLKNRYFTALSKLEASGEDIAYKIEKMHQHINKTGDYLRRPKIALIAPVTSKGANKPIELSLIRGLLPSLFQTISSDYKHVVYLVFNHGDPIFSNRTLVHHYFKTVDHIVSTIRKAYQRVFYSVDAQIFEPHYPLDIDFQLIAASPSILPHRQLSALFNLGTLSAYHEGCDYFYLVNDDLRLITSHWDKHFVSILQNNLVYPDFGVVGGLDVWDTPQPFPEFPFFSKIHVQTFYWCGAQPWSFSNWWEDNWMADIYLPWNSTFYDTNIKVANYVGVLNPTGDPRYEVEDENPPPFFSAEVEAGRLRLQKFLKRHGYIADIKSLNYCDDSRASLFNMDRILTTDIHRSFCRRDVESPTVNIPEFRVNTRGGQSEAYQYAGHDMNEAHLWQVRAISDYGIDVTAQMNGSVDPEFDNGKESTNWLELPNLEDLKFVMSPSGRYFCNLVQQKAESSSCTDPIACVCNKQPTSVMVFHNHVPLAQRYGSDQRLLRIVGSLVGLGANVQFVGREISGFESWTDRMALTILGVQLIAPAVHSNNEIDSYFSKVLSQNCPKLALMSLWFWSAPPVPEQLIQPIRQQCPQTKIVILSDDVHHERQRLLQEMKSKFKLSTEFDSKISFDELKRRELSILDSADIVLTITTEDRNLLEQAMVANGITTPVKRLSFVSFDTSHIQHISISENEKMHSLVSKPFQSDECRVLFVGNGANPINRLSMDWLLHQVIPLIQPGSKLVKLRLLLIGSEWENLPIPDYIHVDRLGRQSKLQNWFNNASLFISPVLSSTGLITKNVLAMEMGIPFVTTRYGSQGLELHDWNNTSPLHDVVRVVDSNSKDMSDGIEAMLKLYANWPDCSINDSNHQMRASARKALQEHALKVFGWYQQLLEVSELL